MIAIIFEVTPNEGMADDYLKIAGEMRGFVEQIDGFISVERFQSLTNLDKLLSRNGGGLPPTAAPRRQAAKPCSATTGFACCRCFAITARTTAVRRHQTALMSTASRRTAG